MKSIRLLSVLLVLSVMLCFWSYAVAEESPALEYSMELSKSSFTAPEKVYVSIRVTNTGSRETDSPVVLSYPDGRMIEEFGSEVLKAGESRQWIGEWRVARAQLKEGKVSFTVWYEKNTGEKDKDGQPKLTRVAETISKRIKYNAPAWEEEFELLQTLEDFFHCWDMEWPDDMLDLCSPAWRSEAVDPGILLQEYAQNYNLRIWEVEDISEPEEDTSVTGKMFTVIKRKDGEQTYDAWITVRLVQEDGKWYVDPASMIIESENG